MRYATVCSGIGAPEVAWGPLGWECAFQSEIEAFPSEVLAHHWPDVPNYGDMTKYKEWPEDGDIGLVCGGTPCQAFSVAGLRKGLDDPRGNLALTFLAIVGKYRPQWVVWENVFGVLSSVTDDAPDAVPPDDGVGEAGERRVVEDGYDCTETHAFACFLAGLSELGYGWGYRVLDAQFVRVDGAERAVPQRRRRVFVVGYLGDWHPAAAVLLERQSMSGHPAPRREAGEGTAVGTAKGVEERGAWCLDRAAFNQWANAQYKPQYTRELAQSMTARGPHAVGVPETAWCLQERDAKGADSDTKPGHLIPGAVAFKPSWATRGKDGAPSEVVPPLSADADKGDQDTVVAFHNRQDPDVSGDVTHPLGCKDNGMGVCIPVDMRNAGRDPDKKDKQNRQGCGVGEDGDPAPTCSTVHVPAVAFQPRIGRNGSVRGLLHEAETGGNTTANSGGTSGVSMTVRRLTPV